MTILLPVVRYRTPPERLHRHMSEGRGREEINEGNDSERERGGTSGTSLSLLQIRCSYVLSVTPHLRNERAGTSLYQDESLATGVSPW